MTLPERKDRLRARLNRKGENLSLAQFHRLRVAIDDARTNDALDHVDAMIENAICDGPPVVWETMVFGGALDGEQDRCSGNRQDAMAMHNLMKERVENSCKTESVKSD